MSFTTLPTVVAGDFLRASWAALVKGDLDDHETRIVAVETSGAGTVTNTGTLTDNAIILGNAGVDVNAMASLGTTTTVLHGNAAGAPTFAAVALSADVSGDLPFANLAQGSALSVLGVTGNATADVASIAAGSDHQVLRRSGTAVAFGAVNLAQSAAVTGDLPFANFAPASAASKLLGRGSASGAGDYEEITLGSGLTMTATTLSASGGGSTTRAIGVTIDGGGSAITTGVACDLYVPVACTITAVTMLADQSGSIVVDIWKDTYANYPPTVADTITASAKPTISGAVKSQDSTLTGWTTSVGAGTSLRFNVDSVTSITRLNLTLTVTV